ELFHRPGKSPPGWEGFRLLGVRQTGCSGVGLAPPASPREKIPSPSPSLTRLNSVVVGSFSHAHSSAGGFLSPLADLPLVAAVRPRVRAALRRRQPPVARFADRGTGQVVSTSPTLPGRRVAPGGSSQDWRSGAAVWRPSHEPHRPFRPARAG